MIGKSLCAVGGQTALSFLIIDFMRIKFDVLYNERFVKMFVYENKSPFPPSDEELREFVISKLPTFKNKDFKIHLY